MGIKFYCPNGHKLNVKSFLGGKKAICPKCGAKVTVPDGSEQPPVSTSEAGTAPNSSSLQPAPAAQPATPIVAAPQSPALSSAAPVAVAAATSTSTSAPVATAVPVTATVDPIDEAPAAMWHMRTPAGQQFGPVAGQVMRSWLNEGRVAREALVWRSGWPQWRTAGTTFSYLPSGAAVVTTPVLTPVTAVPVAPLAAAPFVGMAAAMPATALAPVQAVHPVGVGQSAPIDSDFALDNLGIAPARTVATRTMGAGKKSSGTALGVTIALGVLAVLLVVVLIVVLSNRPKAPDRAADPPPKTTQPSIAIPKTNPRTPPTKTVESTTPADDSSAPKKSADAAVDDGL